MNCQQYWDNPPQRGHAMTEEQSTHVAGCATCASQTQAHEALASGLHSLGEEWRKMEAPHRVEAGLLAAYRAQAGVSVRRSAGPSWWKPVVAWASAAAAMIAIAAFLIRGSQPSPEKPGVIAAPQHTARPTVQVATLLDSDSDDASAVLGEGFVRLPNAAPIEADEEYYVVRVEAPGSDMIAHGFSIGEERASETLLADVAYGSDGTMRAVRLVTDGGTW